MSDAVNPTESSGIQDPKDGTQEPQPTNVVESQSKPRREGKDGEDTAENEIKVAAKGQIKNYLGYAFRVLNKTDHRSLKIRATGNAIVKALILIELVKRRVGDLHQINQIYSMEIVTMEETKLDGVPKVESRRRVTAMDTILSKDPLDENEPGYQKPEPKDDSPMVSKQPKKDKGPNKKKGPKLYNELPGEKKQGEDDKQPDSKQRRDRDKQDKDGKHEQEKERGKRREPRDQNKKQGAQGDDRDEGKDGKKQYENKQYQQRGENYRGNYNNNRGDRGAPRTRGHNLRNLINDDEFVPRNKDKQQDRDRDRDRDMRDRQRGRGGRGGRGGRRGGGPPLDGPPPRGRGDFDRNYNGPMNYGEPGPSYRMREDEDRYHPPMRPYDDFHVSRAPRGGNQRRIGERGRGQPPDMYPMHGGDRAYYNGPPHRYNDLYYQPHYQYGPPPHDMMYGHPPQRGYGQHGGPPMRGREGPMRQPPGRGGAQGPPMRGERGEPPRDPHSNPDYEPRPRGGGAIRARGSGRGRGADHPEGMRAGFGRGGGRDRMDGPGGPPMQRGHDMGGRPMRARGSARGGPHGPPHGDRGGRGHHMGGPQRYDDQEQQQPRPRESETVKVHTRSRGGGGTQNA